MNKSKSGQLKSLNHKDFFRSKALNVHPKALNIHPKLWDARSKLWNEDLERDLLFLYNKFLTLL